MERGEMQQYEEKLKSLQIQLQEEIDSSIESAPVALDGTQGRIARAESMQRQQVAKESNKRRQQRLLCVQSALVRISQGSYGLCCRCQQPISADRLEAFPDVVLCIRCANK